jgi:hypothetical protein
MMSHQLTVNVSHEVKDNLHVVARLTVPAFVKLTIDCGRLLRDNANTLSSCKCGFETCEQRRRAPVISLNRSGLPGGTNRAKRGLS